MDSDLECDDVYEETWEEFLDEGERIEIYFSYKGKHYILSTDDDGFCTLIDPDVMLNDHTYPTIFIGSKNFREFVEQPIPLFGNHSIHETYNQLTLSAMC